MQNVTVRKQLFIAAVGLCLLVSPARAGEEALGAIQDSEAYRQYRLRDNRTDLSKLLYLIDRYRNTPYRVHYEGRDYDSDFALREARKYLAVNYKSDSAEHFIREHAYRPKFGNGILYFKYPDGTQELLRDVLLKELKSLEALKT